MPRKKLDSQVIKRTALMAMGEVVRLGPERPSIAFEFRMTPYPKGRPRSFAQGGKLVVYKDPRSRQYESLIAQATAMQYEWATPLEGDLLAEVTFFLKNRVHGDLDNLLKAILDGMQGVAFHNDKQIRGFTVEAWYYDELPSHDRIERTTVVLTHRHREKSPDAQTTDRHSEPLEDSVSTKRPRVTRRAKPAYSDTIDFDELGNQDKVDGQEVEVCDIGDRLKAGKCANPACQGTIKPGSCKCPVLQRDEFRPDRGIAADVSTGEVSGL